MGKGNRACVTRLPDQGSGCPGFPSMMDLLSNHRPTVDSSLHFLLDGYLVPTKSKATNTACLSIRTVTTPFHKACSHQSCHQSLLLDPSLLLFPPPFIPPHFNAFPSDQSVRLGRIRALPPLFSLPLRQSPNPSSSVTTTTEE